MLARRKAANARQDAEDAARWAAERAAFTGTCFDCRDTGWHSGSLGQPCICAHGRAVAAEQVRQRFTAAWAQAGVPPRCQRFTFASYPLQESVALEQMQAFVDGWDRRRGLILRGEYGTGKTGLLVSGLREIVHAYAASGQHYPVQFVTCTDLMDALRGAVAASKAGRPMGESFAAILDRAKRVQLLAIDDLGAERATPFVLETLFAVINHRYEHELPLFITTNYGLEQLAKRIGPRVFERLLETSDVLAVDGPNLRQRK